MPRSSRLLAAVVAATLVVSGTAVAQVADADVVFFSPTTRAGVAVGVPVLVTGASVTPDTGAVVATELTFDGGATWVQATPVRVLSGFRVDWTYLWTPTAATDAVVAGRAVTASGPGAAGETLVLHVGGGTVPQPVNCAVRCEMYTPYAEEVQDTDTLPVEVGLKVRVDRPGLILGASLGRGAYRGPILLRLWSDGVLLAEQPWDHPGRMAEIDFATPVPVEPGRDYVVSYYTPQGGYLVAEHALTGTVVDAPFTAPHDGVRGAGVYRYGVGGGFPTDGYRDSHYFVQPEFRG
ncbi:DUF4082 domain-containing protein [Saccharothrix sp. Mg75]|uniref:DUF4082 domain-containing protein n=1 Tax=Saccharothrix sp. Mg75 TaxID=3445357 RepID=UPI003EEA01C8